MAMKTEKPIHIKRESSKLKPKSKLSRLAASSDSSARNTPNMPGSNESTPKPETEKNAIGSIDSSITTLESQLPPSLDWGPEPPWLAPETPFNPMPLSSDSEFWDGSGEEGELVERENKPPKPAKVPN
eukprot:278260_1